MKLGFTGTRGDTTNTQFKAMCGRLHDRRHDIAEAHFGCCVGADVEFMEAVRAIVPGAKVIAHPPTNEAMMAKISVLESDEVRPALPYLERNRAIVEACDELWACPKGMEEIRSGTWSTVWWARRLWKPIVIFYPDGTVVEERVPITSGGEGMG